MRFEPQPTWPTSEKGSPRQAWGWGWVKLLITAHPISHTKNRSPEEPMGEAVGLSGFCSSSLEVPPAPPSRPPLWHASQVRPIPASELIARFQAYSPSFPSTGRPLRASLCLKPTTEQVSGSGGLWQTSPSPCAYLLSLLQVCGHPTPTAIF